MSDCPAAMRVLVGFYFFPRGGSAYSARSVAAQFTRHELDVTILSGSRSDLGSLALAEDFFGDGDVRTVDFTEALSGDDPMRFDDGPGTAPMQGSYEDRDGAVDTIFATLDDDTYEAQVAAWARELVRADAPGADLLYLHHLTPLNEAAAQVCPGIPIIGHVHGSELLMLERIAERADEWPHAGEWSERICRWAAACDRIVVNSPSGRQRAARLLDLDPERFALIPNGYDMAFSPRTVDRREHWQHHLVDEPRGWEPGGEAGDVSYRRDEIEALSGPTLIAVGRFTEVKRLPLLIEAFQLASPQFARRTALVLVGGFPGEWEGEHPIETIRRIGANDVFLAGWQPHDRLPDFYAAGDVLVHPSALEQFGQVLVEAMACGLPVIAVDRGGPAAIVEHGRTGWLIEPDDRIALARAMIEAVNQPTESRSRGMRARSNAVARYGWTEIGDELAGLVHQLARPQSLANPVVATRT